MQKVDNETRIAWDESCALDEIPTCNNFIEFLGKRCQRLESVEHSAESFSKEGTRRINNHARNSFVTINTPPTNCICCNIPGHTLYSCSTFLALTPQVRLREARRLSLCVKCLRGGHQLRNCRAAPCRECGAWHHFLLHFDSQPMSSHDQRIPAMPQATLSSHFHSEPATTPASASLVAQDHLAKVVFLATAVIRVQNRSGVWVPCRALLDSGSQVHLVTSRLAHQLQLPRHKSATAVSGLGDSSFCSDGFTINLNLKSLTSEYSASICALVAPTITGNQPSLTVCPDDWRIPNNIRLADPEFHKSQKIDLLIGASLFFKLLCVGQINLSAGLPLLQKTLLGWIVTGGGSEGNKSSALLAQSMSDD
ncbi:hypothetical protein KR009_002602, partial [Drosophila setifemur]